MLRERLNRAGGDAGQTVVTGAGLYLALSRLEGLMQGRVEVYNAETAAASLPGLPAAVAFVNDFTLGDRTGLGSELFTASVVGDMLVGLGKAEGIVLDDDAHGLAVRLHAAVSPALAGLLDSFLGCLDRVTVAVIGELAGRPSSEMALAA